jgi:hypothetical protein
MLPSGGYQVRIKAIGRGEWMTKKIFSKAFRTFTQWVKAAPRTSKYAKQIIRDHERFPNLSLSDLSNLTSANKDMSAVIWDSLTSDEKRDRNLAFEVLRSMRKGERFKNAVDTVGIKRETAIKQLGKYLTKSRGYWRVTSTDSIQAAMAYYDRNQGYISIVTRNSRDRSKIGKYLSAVGKALKTGDDSELRKFRKMVIVDADGNSHHFETDLDALYEIEEAQEEPELFEIYQT